MKATLAQAIESKLALVRDGYSSFYFKAEVAEDEYIKIRVANHQGKKINNGIEEKCISFITSHEAIPRGFGYQGIEEEHLMDEYNYNECGQDIETILEWADLDPNTTEYLTQR